MGPGTPASPQTPWAPYACRLKSRIFRGARSAGCLAGATLTPATVSQLPGPGAHRGVGVGEASFPKVRHLHLPPPPPLATGQRQRPSPLASPLARPRGPSLPCLGLSGRTTWCFPLNPGPFLPLPFSQEGHGLSSRVYVWGLLLLFAPSPQVLTDPCLFAQSPQLPSWAPLFGPPHLRGL